MLDLTALQAVSSAKRLDLTALYFTVFCECELASMKLRLESSILIGVVAIIPLFDAASNDDSNGGQFIIWSKFGPLCENSALGSNPAELCGKFDRF